MTEPEDPGDPFLEGTPRFNARQALLDALENLVDEIRDDDSRPVREIKSFTVVITAHREWARLGRDAD